MEHIVTAVLLGLMFASLMIFEPYAWLVRKYLNFKPFNCALCLSLWGSAAILVVTGAPVLPAFLAAFVTEFTVRAL